MNIETTYPKAAVRQVRARYRNSFR